MHTTPAQSDSAHWPRMEHDRTPSSMLTSRFFIQAPQQPGFLASPTPGGPVIPIFTSAVRLARHAGAVSWFSTTGADLVELAPVGHRFVIDPGTPNETLVDPAVYFESEDGRS